MLRTFLVLAIMLAPPFASFQEVVESFEPPKIERSLCYPTMLKKAGVQGMARVRVKVTQDGRVRDAVGTSGHPLLIAATIGCMRTWKFTPARRNGKPIEWELDISQGYHITPGSRKYIGYSDWHSLVVLEKAEPIRRAEPVISPDIKTGGVVRLAVLIDKKGSVKEAQALSGDPFLFPLALKTITEWRYAPVQRNGKPARAVLPAEIVFTPVDQ